MKKHVSKKTLWQSLLSVTVLGIFILLATGSLSFLNDKTEYLGNGVYETTEYFSDDEYERTTGKRDDKGRWHGPITRYINDGILNSRTEVVNMVNGMRHGKSKYSGYRPFSGSFEYYICYNMGKRIECEESALKSTAEASSYQVLVNKYPWFLFTLNAWGFEDEYVEAYMDTVETVLGTYVFENIEFDDYYGDVISDLEETGYDSIIVWNSTASLFQGMEELKNSEFRLAVFDRYRSDGNSTFNILSSTYPNYLLSIGDLGVNDQNFENFCEVLDSAMTSYGSLDLEDPFFIDSVDVRIYRALFTILEYEESSTSALKSTKISTHSLVNYLSNNSPIDSTTVESASAVLYFMVLQIDQGDMIKRAVREAYFENQGVISIPTVTTEFSSNNSVTSVTLQGSVIEEGGAEVTSRGIVWGTIYNPTTNDNSETSGNGSGSFTISLVGLTEGITYYARTFATNSAGIAYGNCIEFTTTSSVGVNKNEIFSHDLHIYPNPASTVATFSFPVESTEIRFLIILNMKGQVVYQNNLGILPLGENRIELDLSGLQSGIYHCQVSDNGTSKITRRLIIAR